jgi:hypothetical protein
MLLGFKSYFSRNLGAIQGLDEMVNGGNGLGWLFVALGGGLMGLEWVSNGFSVAFSGFRLLILLE